MIAQTDADKLDIDKLKTVPNYLNDLKSKANDISIDKLKTVPVKLQKLSGVVDKVVDKKAVYGQLLATVNDIDTS